MTSRQSLQFLGNAFKKGKISLRCALACLALSIALGTVATCQTNQLAHLVPQLGMKDITSVAFTPNGLDVVLAGTDGAARLWEVRSGRLLRSFQVSGGSIINSVALDPTGKLLLTGDSGGKVRLWNIQTGAEVRQYEEERKSDEASRINSVTFSGDGRSFFAGTDNGVTRLWALESGAMLRSFKGCGPVTAVAFAARSNLLVTAYRRDSCRDSVDIWDVESGSKLRSIVQEKNINSPSVSQDSPLAVSHDERWVVAGQEGGAVMWNLQTGERRFVLKTSDYAYRVDSVAFSPDDQTIVTGEMCRTGTARMWDVKTGKELRSFASLGEAIPAVAFTPDGRGLLTGMGNFGYMGRGYATLWNVTNGKVIRNFEGVTQAISCALFSPDGQTLLVTTGSKMIPEGEGHLDLWDLSTGRPRLSFQAHNRGINSAVFGPNSDVMLTGSTDGTAVLWGAQTGEKLRTLVHDVSQESEMEQQLVPVMAVALSPNGKLALTGNLEGRIHLVNLANGQSRVFFQPYRSSAPGSPALAVAFSLDGALMAAGGRSGTTLWDTATGEVRGQFVPQEDVSSIAFNDNGKLLTTGGAYSTEEWDVLRPNSSSLGSVAGRVNSVQYSLENKSLILTANPDGTARLREGPLWGGGNVRTFQSHDGEVTAASFSPDGNFVVTGSADTKIRLWDASSAKLLVSLLSYGDGKWAVVDPEGHFDTNDLDEEAPFSWVADDDPLRPLPLEIFMRDYYTPGLLKVVLNRQQDKVPKLPPIGAITNRVQPDVVVTRVVPARSMPGRVSVIVQAASHADEKGMKSGLQDLRLFRDGQLVPGGYLEGSLDDGDYTFENIVLKHGAAKVTFTAYAFNRERIKSATASLDYTPPPVAKQTSAKAHAYLLQIGVNQYLGEHCTLHYAVSDADAMSDALSASMAAQGYIPVAVKLTAPEKGDAMSASKQRIQAELQKIAAAATPDDVFFMTFSGHGYSDASEKNGGFYLLPSGLTGSCRKVNAALLEASISADELAQWLRPIDAGEMTLILDACDSAASVDSGGFKPGPLGSRGLGQLAYDKRMRVLAASQADESAQESGKLQHGVLTYALIQNGLKEQKADWKPVDKKITVGEWLSYAEKQVQQLSSDSTQTTAGRSAGDRYGNDGKTIQVPALFDFSKVDKLLLQSWEGRSCRAAGGSCPPL